jgi:hypothetical protein
MNEPTPKSQIYTERQIKKWISSLIPALLLLSTLAYGQAAAPTSTAPTTCPILFGRFNPSSMILHIRNTSGKNIVGLVFNAALADATEHWKWYHWDFDDTRPVRNFGWNKTIKLGAAKTLSWSFTNLDFEHGGGGAFVLTSALFDDGSTWELPSGRTSCMCLWYNSHKKGLIRPVELPSPSVAGSQ